MFRRVPYNNYYINNRPQISSDIIRKREMVFRINQSLKITDNLENPSLPVTENQKIVVEEEFISRKLLEKWNISTSPKQIQHVLLSLGLNKKDYLTWSENTWNKLVQTCTQPEINFRIQSSQSIQKTLETKIYLGEFHLLSQAMSPYQLKKDPVTKGMYFHLPKDSFSFQWKSAEGSLFIRLRRFTSVDKQFLKTNLILKVNDQLESARIFQGEVIYTKNTLLDKNLFLLLSLVNEKDGESVPFPSTFDISFSVYK